MTLSCRSKRAGAVAAILVAACLLSGCASRESCEAKGGEWIEKTVLMPMIVGKVTVIMPMKVHECEVPSNG